MIGCQQAEAARLELAGGELPSDQSAALEEHLAACATCSAFVLEIDALEAGLAQVTHAGARSESTPQLPPRSTKRLS